MNIHNITNTEFEEPRFDSSVVMGIPYTEMKNAIAEVEAAAKDLNRLGINGFEFVKCTLTKPIDEVRRSIFPSSRPGSTNKRKVIKLDRNLTYMIDLHFNYLGEPLSIANVRIPMVTPGSKFVMWSKNYFIRNVLVDRGINLAKGELFIRLDRTSFSMIRTTHPYLHNSSLECDNVLTGNPHCGGDNKVGKSPDRISAIQNLMLYLLGKYGWTKTLEMMGTNLKAIEAESYEAAYNEWYPKGYTVFGSSGIKTSDGGPKSNWIPPNIYLLYKGDLEIGSEEHIVASMVVANFYYIADRIPSYISVDVMDEADFWANILGRFIFFRAGKPGQWYTDEGQNHLANSMDTLIDIRTKRTLLRDGIDVADTYELMAWLMKNEREVYANVHPSDVSRKRVTTIRYLLSYIFDNINRLGYKLLGNTDPDGNFKPTINRKKLNDHIRMWLNEGTVRSLIKKQHGEVTTLESPSSNMFITNTRALIDQTKVKGSAKERNHMYNTDNVFHPSKMMRCRVDGIDSTPSGATQINALSMDMSKDTAMTIPKWLEDIEAELSEDLKGTF